MFRAIVLAFVRTGIFHPKEIEDRDAGEWQHLCFDLVLRASSSIGVTRTEQYPVTRSPVLSVVGKLLQETLR
jgi:hypothetical protein